MLPLSGITKAYGDRVLFADATLQVNREDRIGLVGPNGAGKTTLFSIILGEESSDEGKVTKERGLSFGYLPQENAPVADETVVELATALTPEYTKLRRILKAWEADHPTEALHSEEIHDDVHDRFNELGGYRLEAKAKQILAAYKHQEREIGRLMEFVNRFRAKNTKATQAQSKLKQIERMDKIEAPTSDERQIDFKFPQPQRSGLKVIKLDHVHHAYGEN